MATDTLAHTDQHDSKSAWDGGERPFKASYGKLMMWYFLLSDAFTFSGFLIAYGALRFSMPSWPIPDKVFSSLPFDIHNKPLYFVTFMTFVLLFSSFTMVRAVQEGQRENKKGVVNWMILTVIGGLAFLSCQAWEWNTLIAKEHASVTTNPFGTHVDSGVYLDAKGNPSDEVFNPGDTYLIHKITTHAHGAAHSDDHHGSGHSADDHGKEDAAHSHGAAHYEGAGDYPDAYVDERGFIHRKYKVLNSETLDPGAVVHEPFGPKAFGALFFFITGFHGFHVLSGVIFLIIILVNVATGLYVERKNGYEMVEKIGLYWHFVDLVWIFVFLVFYLL